MIKKITFYTLRKSKKLTYLLLCTVLCCTTNAQEIDFQDKPYIISYNNRKYQFCPVDLNILKCERFADICEAFFQFHIFFCAWPNIKTPSRESFIICFNNISFFSNSSIFMIEDLVIYVDRKTGKILNRNTKNIIKYQCNKHKVFIIEKFRNLDSPDDMVSTVDKCSNLGPSNMKRIENKDVITWEFDKTRSQATNELFNE